MRIWIQDSRPYWTLLVAYLGWAAGGLWWAMVLSNVGAALVSVAFFLKGGWQEKVIEEEKPPARIYEEA